MKKEQASKNGRAYDGVADAVVTHDGASRRRFIRAGSAFLLSGGVVAGDALASDCDSAVSGPKKPGQEGSDSDSGATADRAGCGRRRDKPKLTKTHQTNAEKIQVARTTDVPASSANVTTDGKNQRG